MCYEKSNFGENVRYYLCIKTMNNLMIAIKIIILFITINVKGNNGDHSAECVAIAVRELCDMRGTANIGVFPVYKLTNIHSFYKIIMIA